jgi:hypothetical protein
VEDYLRSEVEPLLAANRDELEGAAEDLRV